MGKRVFLVVIDSCGVGYAPDANEFFQGDQPDVGCDTFGSCVYGGRLYVPVLEQLGILDLDGVAYKDAYYENLKKQGIQQDGPLARIASYAKLQEESRGKDTTVGHWEITGVASKKPLPTYPNGFPDEVLDAFEQATGRGVLCNKPYSGTTVLHDYGQEHLDTGALIVYTSADSVFQIAAHEELVPLEELYDACHKAREILVGDHGVGRVIARPFVGTFPDFKRTENRHDYSMEPPQETVLDQAKAAGFEVIGVGKIHDIFAGRGLTETYPNHGNAKNMELTLSLMDRDFTGLCFVNLVDTDMVYGHRRDVPGYSKALNAVDLQFQQFIDKMKEDDILIITGDHGCDPGFIGTDHTREYVPCLIYGDSVEVGKNLGVKPSFAYIADYIREVFDL